MSPQPGTNWQLMLADLSIILFLATFSAMAHGSAKPAKAPAPAARAKVEAPAPPVVAEPIALWRSGGGAPPLGEWLKGQQIDGRMKINVHGAYSAGHRDTVLAEATDVTADPALAAKPVRLILEPAEADSVTVTLSFDNG